MKKTVKQPKMEDTGKKCDKKMTEDKKPKSKMKSKDYK